MPNLAKHTLAFCVAILIAGASFNAVTSVPPAGGAQPLTTMATPELA